MAKKILSFIFCFLLLLLVIPSLNYTIAEWIKNQDNPIIPEKVDKKELINNPRSPAILLENGIFKMWFMNKIDGKWNLDFITSKNGINWIKPYTKALLSPDDNELEIGEPTILKVNNIYHLWYTALLRQDFLYKIKHAWSYDGYEWIRDENIALYPTRWWEQRGVVNPYVLYINNQYWMWYGAWGNDGNWRIGFVKSNDGINWPENEKILLNLSPNIQHVGNHNLKYFDNKFHLWYLTGNSNNEEIYELISNDGINWSCNRESCLVLRKDFINFPNSVLNDSDTLKIGEKILIYFSGIHNGNWHIGLASNTDFVFNTYPLILLPGLFASWNKSAILYNQSVNIFDWKLNPFVHEYDGIINTMKNLGLVENQDFYVFPYDWRKSVEQSSDDLKTFITNKISPDKKVNLIGHSLGGLVSRIFTQKNKDKVNKIVTVGSPHEGVVQVYKPLSAGEIDRENTFLWLAQKLVLILNKSSLEKDKETIKKRFPVALDLFPTFDFLKNQQNQEIPIDNLSIKNNLLLQYNQTFSQIFDRFVSFYGEKDSQTPAGYVVGPANLFHQVLGNYQDGQPINLYYDKGDYTVLSKSANKDTDSENLNFDHGEIITKEQAIKKILNKIDIYPEDNQIIEGKKTKISPSLIFLIKSPAKMTLKTAAGQLIEEKDGLILLEEAESGNYQLQVQGIEKGKYTLITGQITDQNDIWETKEGEITQDPPSSQTDSYSFYFNNNQALPIFPSPSPSITPSPTLSTSSSPSPTPFPIPSPTSSLISSPSNSQPANSQTNQSNNPLSNYSNSRSLISKNNFLSKNTISKQSEKPEILGIQNDKSNSQTKVKKSRQKNKLNSNWLILSIILTVLITVISFFFIKSKKFSLKFSLKKVADEGVEPPTSAM